MSVSGLIMFNQVYINDLLGFLQVEVATGSKHSDAVHSPQYLAYNGLLISFYNNAHGHLLT